MNRENYISFHKMPLVLLNIFDRASTCLFENGVASTSKPK